MKTKNFYGWLAMAVMLVGTGCSTDEVVNDFSPKNAIQFGTYVGRDAESRAHSIDETKLKEEGFGVFAYYTDEGKFNAATSVANFMYNQKVEYKTSAWEYTPVKYWPNEATDYVSFLAYAPHKDAYFSNGINGGKIQFTVDNDVKKQTDLLWNDTKQIDVSKQTITGTVNFNFSHALSRIGFTAQAAVDEIDVVNNALAANTEIVINKVVLLGDSILNLVEPTGVFYKSGTLNLNNFRTSTDPVPADWENKVLSQAFTLTKEDNFVTDFKLTSTNSKNKNPLNNGYSYIMIIPQDLSSTGFYIYVDYTVTTTDNENVANTSVVNNKIMSVNPLQINFESGKAYTINLLLGMTSVKFTATYTDWKTGEHEVDLPINTTTPPNP